MVSISPNRVKGAEFHRNVWCVTPEAHVAFADVMAPGYFTHVAAQLRVGDHIEVVPEGGAWYAELFVRAASRLDVTLGVLNAVNFTLTVPDDVQSSKSPIEKGSPEEYYVKWGGPKAKFRVHRAEDHQVLQDGFDTEASAQAWLSDHQQRMVA